MRRPLLSAAVGAFIVLAPTFAFAQNGGFGGNSGGGNSGGGFGGSSGGGSGGGAFGGSGGNSGGSGGFGNSSSGGSFGQTGFGNSTSSGSSSSTGSFGVSNGTSALSSGLGNASSLGRTTGGSSNGSGNGTSRNGLGSNNNSNNMRRTMGGAGFGGSQSGGTSDPAPIGPQRYVRPFVRFDLPRITIDPKAVSGRALASLTPPPPSSFVPLQSLPSPVLRSAGVRFEANTGVAIVSGIATSDHQRRLAAALLSLEPGVREVRNDVTIVPPADK